MQIVPTVLSIPYSLNLTSSPHFITYHFHCWMALRQVTWHSKIYIEKNLLTEIGPHPHPRLILKLQKWMPDTKPF